MSTMRLTNMHLDFIEHTLVTALKLSYKQKQNEKDEGGILHG